jgi:hypothetical protein
VVVILCVRVRPVKESNVGDGWCKALLSTLIATFMVDGRIHESGQVGRHMIRPSHKPIRSLFALTWPWNPCPSSPSPSLCRSLSLRLSRLGHRNGRGSSVRRNKIMISHVVYTIQFHMLQP